MGIFDYFKRLRAQKPPEPAPEPVKGAEPKHEEIVREPPAPVRERITARELSEKLAYREPLIISVDKDLREVPLEERSVGKFVVCVKDDEVRLFGILYLGEAYKRKDFADDLKHRQFHMVLSSIDKSYLAGYGLELGGGELKIDFAAKKAVAQGFSGTFGRPPRSFVEKALALDGYSIQIVMGEAASPDPHDNRPAVDWFSSRGVTTGDPWSSE